MFPEEVTQYLMLRPLLTSVPGDVLPGVSGQPGLHLSHLWHTDLHRAAVSLANLQPGDAVFLHPDILHSFQMENSGRESVTVVYLGLGPDCPLNRHYQRRLQHSLLQGTSPPDFSPQEESEEMPSLLSLTARELLVLGFPPDLRQETGREGSVCSRSV